MIVVVLGDMLCVDGERTRRKASKREVKTPSTVS